MALVSACASNQPEAAEGLRSCCSLCGVLTNAGQLHNVRQTNTSDGSKESFITRPSMCLPWQSILSPVSASVKWVCLSLPPVSTSMNHSFTFALAKHHPTQQTFQRTLKFPFHSGIYTRKLTLTKKLTHSASFTTSKHWKGRTEESPELKRYGAPYRPTLLSSLSGEGRGLRHSNTVSDSSRARLVKDSRTKLRSHVLQGLTLTELVKNWNTEIKVNHCCQALDLGGQLSTRGRERTEGQQETILYPTGDNVCKIPWICPNSDLHSRILLFINTTSISSKVWINSSKNKIKTELKCLSSIN